MSATVRLRPGGEPITVAAAVNEQVTPEVLPVRPLLTVWAPGERTLNRGARYANGHGDGPDAAHGCA